MHPANSFGHEESGEALYPRPGTSNSHICRNDDTTIVVTEDPKDNSSWRKQNSFNIWKLFINHPFLHVNLSGFLGSHCWALKEKIQRGHSKVTQQTRCIGLSQNWHTHIQSPAPLPPWALHSLHSLRRHKSITLGHRAAHSSARKSWKRRRSNSYELRVLVSDFQEMEELFLMNTSNT